MEKKYKNIIKSSLFATAVTSGLIVAMVLLANVNEPIIEQVKPRERHWTLFAGPSPVAMAVGGVTGIVGIWIHEHWANGSYNNNMTDIKDSYAYELTQYNKSLGGNVPAATAFDIIITARIKNEDIANSSVFQPNWARMNLTCPVLSIAALTAADGQDNITDQVKGDTIDALYNFYWNNSGSGFTIGNGVNVNVTEFTLEVYT